MTDIVLRAVRPKNPIFFVTSAQGRRSPDREAITDSQAREQLRALRRQYETYRPSRHRSKKEPA